MRMITASFTRVLQRCAGHLCMHFLAIFQELSRVSKTCNQLIGYSGHKHQKGDKVIAIIDNHGYVLAPVPVAPVNETDMVLLPEGLKALKEVAKEVGLD